MQALALAAADLPAQLIVPLICGAALICVVGHLAGSRRTLLAGLALLFAASALMIAGGYLAYRDDPSDPRPCAQPGSCR